MPVAQLRQLVGEALQRALDVLGAVRRERLLEVLGDAVVVHDDAGALPAAVRFTRAIAWSSSASWIERSRYMTCSTGASKPVSSIDFTMRNASGSLASGVRVARSGFLKRAMRDLDLGGVGPLLPAGSSLLSAEMIGTNSSFVSRSRLPRMREPPRATLARLVGSSTSSERPRRLVERARLLRPARRAPARAPSW